MTAAHHDCSLPQQGTSWIWIIASEVKASIQSIDSWGTKVCGGFSLRPRHLTHLARSRGGDADPCDEGLKSAHRYTRSTLLPLTGVPWKPEVRNGASRWTLSIGLWPAKVYYRRLGRVGVALANGSSAEGGADGRAR